MPESIDCLPMNNWIFYSCCIYNLIWYADATLHRTRNVHRWWFVFDSRVHSADSNCRQWQPIIREFNVYTICLLFRRQNGMNSAMNVYVTRCISAHFIVIKCWMKCFIIVGWSVMAGEIVQIIIHRYENRTGVLVEWAGRSENCNEHQSSTASR